MSEVLRFAGSHQTPTWQFVALDRTANKAGNVIHPSAAMNCLQMFVLRPLGICALAILLALSVVQVAAVDVGVARLDVTPVEPIRLTGYAVRQTNSTGVEQKLWAKAVAIGSDREGPALLLTLDNCGIAEGVYREIIRRLARRAKIKQERIAISCSHTHSGPCTTDWAPNIFVQNLPAEQLATIDRYTRTLLDKIEQVAVGALKDRRSANLSWSQGRVGFARNRRVVRGNTAQFGDNASAPVDHSLPVLRVTDHDGKIRALIANYACHCTTLGGEVNHICGDWAGYAQEYLERDHPGAVALVTIGCGADANPSPRGGADGGLAFARQHGDEIAAEIKRLLGLTFTPLNGKLTTRLKEIDLPFGPQFTREQWEERGKKGGIVGYHARKQLARLDRGEKLADSLYYPVSTWFFGNDLALVFLPGEVVVDYVLRLKQEFDSSRLWVTAYANYVPCYIPSRRILAEGGYEAEDSLWYYDRPARLSTNAEDLIIKTVHELVPKQFLLDKRKAEFPDPKTPQQALATFRTKADFAVEIAASEPLIESPVAIDWGVDGRLWVCEMYDYPSGIGGTSKPGGRIKVLTDLNGDGRYDKAQLFLSGLAFPTGVMPWRKGALICAAPDILYAEDTNGDGQADLVRTNFTGFATHNYQARVNGFTWGLDGWLHGSSGLFGGKVKSLLAGREVDLSGRDFRIKPDTGEIEPVAGLSQMGRVRDDFDNWFGNDNSTLLWNYPLPDHYIRRNPHVTYPDPRVLVGKGADANKLFPVSRALERFNHPESVDRVTGACGIGIYRDHLLGANYEGNAFVCEPVHNLITRLVLESNGVTFAGRRAVDEQRGEFLASTDNWFRPVQVRTGPDGALWVVDMYRFVIEHPRWIPPERLKDLDPRAGADKGRIYRLYPRGAKLRPIRDLKKLNESQLASALNTPNGLTRDLVHRELVERGLQIASSSIQGKDSKRLEVRGSSSVVLHRLATNGPAPAIRVQALSALADLRQLPAEIVQRAMADSDPRVRRHALRLGELFLGTRASSAALASAARSLLDDPDAGVRFQLASSLGEWNEPWAPAALATLAQTNDRWLRAAVLSSSQLHLEDLLKATRDWPADTAGRTEFVAQLCAVAVGSGDSIQIQRAIEAIAPGEATDLSWFDPLAALLDAVERRSLNVEQALSGSIAGRRVFDAFASARRKVSDAEADETLRERSIRLLARSEAELGSDVSQLCSLLLPPASGRLQTASLHRLRSVRDRSVAKKLLAQWTRYSPQLRSRVLAVLLAREDWTRELLEAVKGGAVAIAEVSPADQQRLLKHSTKDLRETAEALLHRPGTRAEVLGRFNRVGTLTPVPERGGLLFEKNCAPCHAFRGRGHEVGPNLAEFAGKTVPDFLVAVLDPNSAINPNFVGYNVETKDGRSLSGIVRSETASSLTLVQGGGLREIILRTDIEELRASQLSLMPEGLEQALTPQDLADLIGWVKQGAPAGFGSATSEQTVKARSEFLNGGMDGLAKVVTCVEQLPYPSWLGRLPLAYCRQAVGQNRLVWRTAPLPAKLEATHAFRLPAAMGFVSNPPGKFTLKLNGQPLLDFDVALSDRSWESADGRARLAYSVIEANSEDSNGVLVIEVASSFLKAGQSAEFEVTGSASNSQRWFGVYLVGQ